VTPLRAATGDPVEVLPVPKVGEEALNPLTFTPPKIGQAPPKLQNIELTANGQIDLGVDKVFGTHEVPGYYGNAPHLGSTRYVEQGETLQYEVKNVTGAHHPFHLHGFSIQPISLSNGGETFTFPPEFRDNVDVPGGFTLKFRVRTDPRPLVDGVTPGGALGRWVFHCHIFFHATNGMISEVVVTAPNGNERPDVNVDNYELSATQGGTATVTGTYSDIDGDPVTLSSSVGSVDDHGNGTFTWSYPTSAPGSQIVYITATASNGLRGQIPLFLRVLPAANPANTAPVLRKLRMFPKRFAPARALTKLKANASARKRHGAKIRFTLSEAAKVQFTIKRLRPKRPRVKVPKFTRTVRSGGKKVVRFTARFKHKRVLPPGKYKLTAQATDSAGLKSRRVSTRFKIVR